ncbi:MAG: hypothetical protein GWN58_34015, partial [Anaerolineae bacterium]|nr:hypothetical protein [Thermoplasmata archaeon]NIV34296.1 hypothetical protein [Anaerolineae bacterium]NIY06145.1 hypothetical protein [Thermoplasmata archaeon]
MADWTLWIQGSDHLFYNTSRGTPQMWKSVDLAPLAADINGLWGPTNAFKIYVVVEEKGIFYWDGADWTQEYDTGGVGGPWTSYNRPDTRTVSGADDDTLVIASGFGDWYEKIVARQGPPGTSWNTEFDPGTNTYQVLNCHCAADGSAAFATLQDWNTSDLYLYERTAGPPGGPGTWAQVASFTQGTVNAWWYHMWVVSSTEVYVLGELEPYSGGPDQITIWKWNGSTFSVVFTESSGWCCPRGIWMSKDGTEGWAIAATSDWPEYDKMYRYSGGSWSLQGSAEVNYVCRDITQIDGEFSSTRSLAYWSYYNKMDASNAWIGNTNYGIPGYTYGCNSGDQYCRRASLNLGSFGSGSIEIRYFNHAPDTNPTLWAAYNGKLAYSL